MSFSRRTSICLSLRYYRNIITTDFVLGILLKNGSHTKRENIKIYKVPNNLFGIPDGLEAGKYFLDIGQDYLNNFKSVVSRAGAFQSSTDNELILIEN